MISCTDLAEIICIFPSVHILLCKQTTCKIHGSKNSIFSVSAPLIVLILMLKKLPDK